MKISKKITAVLTACSLCLGMVALAGCTSEPASSSASSSAKAAASSSASAAAQGTRTFTEDELATGTHHAVIQVEGYDPITVTLDADSAPQTVTNFMDLAGEGYYDGKTFYRIVDDFCLQGGTLGNNAGGNDPELETITGEFSGNDVDNPLADNFDRGTIAMARTSLPNSATSTFFITLGDADQVGSSLNGQYAAFGTIDETGMAVVDQIVTDYLKNVDDPQMGAISDETKQPVITSITISD